MDGAHAIMEGPPAALRAALLLQRAHDVDSAHIQVFRGAQLVDLQRQVHRRAPNAPTLDDRRGVWAKTGGPRIRTFVWTCAYDDIRRAYVPRATPTYVGKYYT